MTEAVALTPPRGNASFDPERYWREGVDLLREVLGLLNTVVVDQKRALEEQSKIQRTHSEKLVEVVGELKHMREDQEEAHLRADEQQKVTTGHTRKFDKFSGAFWLLGAIALLLQFVGNVFAPVVREHLGMQTAVTVKDIETVPTHP